MIYMIALLMFVIFFVLASVIGFGVSLTLKQEVESLIHVYIRGMLAIILAFSIIAFSGSLMHIQLKYAGLCWLVLVLLYIMYLIAFMHKSMIVYLRKGLKFKKKQWPVYLFGVAIVLLLLVQIVTAIGCAYNQPDVIRYVGNATKAYETGAMTATSPLLMFYAYLADICHVHPMTMIFSIMPAVMLPMYYAVAYSVFRKTLKDDDIKVLFAMLIYNLLMVWGYQSAYTTELILLYSYFSGICVFVYAFLPVCMLELSQIYESYRITKARLDSEYRALGSENIQQGEILPDEELSERELSDDEWEELDMKKHRIINSRNLAIVLLLVIIAMAAVIFLLNRKINSLYNLEVDLQNKINSSASVYEYTPDGSSKSAYIISQDSKGLTVLGTVDAEYADELYDYLVANGGAVSNWYLHSDSEDDCAAYNRCADRGLSVEHVFYAGFEEK